jgi:hypothetical protein
LVIEFFIYVNGLPRTNDIILVKVVTVISLTINSLDNSDEDYRPGPQDEEEGYGTVCAQQDKMGGAQR